MKQLPLIIAFIFATSTSLAMSPSSGNSSGNSDGGMRIIDVCKQPGRGTPVPRPYPNTANSSHLSGSKKVKTKSTRKDRNRGNNSGSCEGGNDSSGNNSDDNSSDSDNDSNES